MAKQMVRRAWRLLRREGPFGFAMVVVRTYLADFRRYYLYEYDLWSKACMRLPPLPEGFDGVFVADNDTADVLAMERRDFRCFVSAARHALDSGAIALCLYHGREMAHVGWIATSHAARRSLDRLEYEIRFDRGEAWAGAVYTAPRFRGRGLLSYSALSRFAYLRDAGFDICRSAVEMNNGASNRVQMRFEPHIYAIAQVDRLFAWRRWSERPARPDELPSPPRT